MSPTEQAAGQRVTDPENAPKRNSKGKGRGRGGKGRGKGNKGGGKGRGKSRKAEVERSAEPPKKRTRKSKQDADNGTTLSGMSNQDISTAGPGESKNGHVAKAAPKAKATAQSKAKAKAKSKAVVKTKGKASPKKRGRKPNADTHGKKAKAAEGGAPMNPDGGDDGDRGSDDGKPHLTPEQIAIRARNSRKSSAYHRAYKAALKQGMEEAGARAVGKEASLIYNMN